MFTPNHQHLLVKGYIQNPPKETETINKWFIELLESVSMNVVAGPTSVYVDEKGNEGLTGTVTLATSHASIHIWDAEKPSLFQFDIYSCKCFDIETVLTHLDKFNLLNFEYLLIDRNNGLKVTEEGNGEW